MKLARAGLAVATVVAAVAGGLMRILAALPSVLEVTVPVGLYASSGRAMSAAFPQQTRGMCDAAVYPT